MIAAEEFSKWTAHFNQDYYEGDWSGIAMRTTVGTHLPLYQDPAVKEFTDLPILEHCLYIKETVAAFLCPVQTIRLLRLGAGAVIKEHRDLGLEYKSGEMRVHVPIRTSQEVEFVLGGERLVLAAGEAWYLNVNLPHSVRNHGESDRVHLVFDCNVNDWVRAMFA